MSYCRFSECDVCAYDSSDGGVQFHVSSGRRDLDRLCATYTEAYHYAKTLRDKHGLDVPDHAIEALKADALEEAARICGPDSAVAELEAENAKLREQGERLFDKTLELGTENAKLRELCVKALEWLRWAGGITCPPEVPDKFADELRELGIEVES